MKIIAHRINTVSALRQLDLNYGAEVDIRSFGSDLIMQHEPFERGELFSDWLKEYKHGFIILNVKEEGLEPSLIELMESCNIQDYFFLDQSFPFMIKYSESCDRRCAVRYSEFESIDTVLNVSHLVSWVWVDCFNQMPLDTSTANRLAQAALKICVVSPELQGRQGSKELTDLVATLKDCSIIPDAVCTKRPAVWQKEFSN